MRFRNKKTINKGSDGHFDKNNTSRYYESLTPQNDIDNGQEYIAALDWALSEPDVSNIAISGPYGSGKSSVIESYLGQRPGLKALRISLAAFNLGEMIDGDNDVIDEELLETGILKQLFYSVDSCKIPQSRYRKLQPETKWKSPLEGLLTLIVLCIVVCFSAPDKTNTFITSINDMAWWGAVTVYVGIFGVLWYIFTSFVKWLRKHGNIQEIRILDKAAFSNESAGEESVFNKNMDEIVYFFETTKTNLVVIEDLDRFESTNIFVALRELNNILNHYEKIERSVKFIYAIKDDMFEKQGERTKFFDFIIPIVPYISSTNSGEILRRKLRFDDVKNRSSIYEISGSFISLISPYISDMRDLTCICNEFNVFKNTLKGSQQLDLIDEHMFALIVFKNLHPKDFACLEDESEDSIVKRAFLDKKKLIERRGELIESRKRIEADKIEQMEKETLQSAKELKLALVTSLIDFRSAVFEIYDGKENYPLATILSDDFDIDVFKRKQITVYWNSNYRNERTSINNIDEVIKDRGDYFTRISYIKKGLVKCKEESRRTIEEYEKKMNELRACSIREIIKEFGTDFLDESVRRNDLLVFLLRHGYLDENYENYMNYFYPNSISKEEMNFILGVRNHRSEVEYSYPIKNVEQVFSRLQYFEFIQKEALNFDLVDYVLCKKLNTASANALMEQLSDHTEQSMSFIKAYIERGENIDKLIHHLCKRNHLFWKDITDDYGISLDTRFKYLVLLLKYAHMDDIVAQDTSSDGEEGALTEFFKSHADVLKNIKEVQTDKQIKVIENFKIKFYDIELDTVDEAIREEVFGSCRYELNNLMIQRLFEWKAPEQVRYLKDKNYTSVLNLGYQPLIDYVRDYFTEYITDIVLGTETNENEEISALEDIIERLLPDNEELCLKVLEKEKTVWGDIKYCCKNIGKQAEQSQKKIWDFLLNNSRIQCTWDNFIAYYEQYGSEACWSEYFEENIDILLNSLDNPVVTEDVLYALMFVDITEESFKKYILSVEVKPYEDSLAKLNKMKIKVMIENRLLPFNRIYWDEMDSVASELRDFYAEVNKDAFIAALDDIEIKEEEINSLLQSECFDSEEKQKILSRLDVRFLEIETAKIIKKLSFKIDRSYTDAAWAALEEHDKYELLLNQIDTFQNEELPDLFEELAPVYHQLIERTRHKFKFAYSDYNKALLDKLVQKDYITSAEAEWVDKGEHILFNQEKERIITGYVKQVKV